MKTIALALLLSPFLPQDDPLTAEALKGWQHPWAGFGDGSSVTLRETTQRPDIDASGKLVYRDVTNEVTWTVTQAQGEKTTLRVKGVGQESEIPYFISLPGWTRGVAERRGEEELVVGGVKRVCQVTVIALDVTKDAGQLTTISKCAALPYWAVRRRVETLVQGKPNTSEEELLLEVDLKAKVGDREVSCVLVQVTVETVGGRKTVSKEWRSDEVPGRVLRRETREYQNGKELESAGSQMDVVRFKGKR